MRTIAVVLAAGLLGAGCASSESSFGDSVAPVAPAETPGPAGEVEVEHQASCVEAYSPAAVSGRGFAFDGRVTAIGVGSTDRPGEGHLGYAGVTFAVRHWFVRDDGSSITIDMAPPSGGARLEETPPTYEVGTRLLVSGESRWGGPGLEDALAWGCGFTRYYDAETAKEWLDATNPAG
jgi:hypothetical protein